jgi:hypothetical protein
MKKILILFAALSLSGCATQFGERITEAISAVQHFTITQGQLDTARTAYDGAVLAPMRRYAMLPYCKRGQIFSINVPCHDRGLLSKIRNADRVVEKGFAETQAKITSGDNTGAVLAYDTLKFNIDLAKVLIGKSGVQIL